MGDNTIDMDDHTFKICLLTNSYSPSAAHSVYANLTNEVANGNGYITGGKVLIGVTWSESAGTVTFDANDPQWTNATFTCRYAVIYDDTPADPADPLVLLFDFGADKSATGSTFTVQFGENGIVTSP